MTKLWESHKFGELACDVSDLLAVVGESQTMAMSALYKRLQEANPDQKFVNFTLGEDPFEISPEMKEALAARVDSGLIKYTPAAGSPALRTAVAESYQERYGVEIGAGSVIVSNGLKPGLDTLMRALLQPGDKVVIQQTSWVSYQEQVKLNRGIPVIQRTREEDGFMIDPYALYALLQDDAVKLVMIDSPGNPTGHIYPRERMEGIMAVLRVVNARRAERREAGEDVPFAYLLLDSIYQELCFDAPFVHPLAIDPGFEWWIEGNGIAKSGSGTGLRCGWVVAPPRIIEEMTKVQSQTASGPNALGEEAALALLTRSRGYVEEKRETLKALRDLMFAEAATIPGLVWNRQSGLGAGGLYAFMDLSQAMPGFTDAQICRYLVEAAHTVLVPGSAFLMPDSGYVRATFAKPAEEIALGMQNIGDALQDREKIKAFKDALIASGEWQGLGRAVDA